MSARTILNPPIINELNGLFNGTGAINTEVMTSQYIILGENLELTSATNTLLIGGGGGILDCGNINSSGTISTIDIQSDTSLTIKASSGVINVVTESIGLFSADSTTAVSLACIDSVFTVVGGAINATYTGGLGFYKGFFNPGLVSPNGAYNASIIIPNFVGSASSAYVISCNVTATTIPMVPFNPFSSSVSFTSSDPTTNTTTVAVQIVNISSLTADFDWYFSIIAMN